MKKTIIIVISILLIVGIFITLLSRIISQDKVYNFGPYPCGNKQISIVETIHINKLEGVSFIGDVSIQFGSNIFNRFLFSPNIVGDFDSKEIDNLIKKQEEEYIESNTSDVYVFNQKFNTYERREDFISDKKMSKSDFDSAVSCFKQNSEKFYSDLQERLSRDGWDSKSFKVSRFYNNKY